jgi:ABC-type sugar transport system ATPase subunit
VAENVLLDELSGSERWAIPWRKLYGDAQRFFDKLGFAIDVTKKVSKLSTGQSQLVEIARAIRSRAEIIIMDEPTSALTENESEHLFKIIDGLKKDGKIIFYVSHRMNEIRRVADQIVILRDGIIAGVNAVDQYTQEDIIKLMVGREVADIYPNKASTEKSKKPAYHPAFEVAGLCVGSMGPFDFKVHPGEILGFCGLMGSGRSELFLALFGYGAATTGTIKLNGEPMSVNNPAIMMDAGVAMVTEDRKGLGLCLNRPARENMSLAALRHDFAPQGLWGPLSHKKEVTAMDGLAHKLKIKGPSLNADVETYSGGNQQKVYLAKCLAIKPRVLILDEPTRGVDIGAKIEIYHLMRELTASGVAVILISSEMPELMGMSDSIIVMKAGRFQSQFQRRSDLKDGFDPTQLMKAASL